MKPKSAEKQGEKVKGNARQKQSDISEKSVSYQSTSDDGLFLGEPTLEANTSSEIGSSYMYDKYFERFQSSGTESGGSDLDRVYFKQSSLHRKCFNRRHKRRNSKNITPVIEGGICKTPEKNVISERSDPSVESDSSQRLGNVKFTTGDEKSNSDISSNKSYTVESDWSEQERNIDFRTTGDEKSISDLSNNKSYTVESGSSERQGNSTSDAKSSSGISSKESYTVESDGSERQSNVDLTPTGDEKRSSDLSSNKRYTMESGSSERQGNSTSDAKSSSGISSNKSYTVESFSSERQRNVDFTTTSDEKISSNLSSNKSYTMESGSSEQQGNSTSNVKSSSNSSHIQEIEYNIGKRAIKKKIERAKQEKAGVSEFEFVLNRGQAFSNDLFEYSTFINMISNNKALRHFKNFLAEEFADETIDFLKQVDKFLELFEIPGTPQCKKCQSAERICNLFITGLGRYTLNLPSEIVEEITENLTEEKITANLFDSACQEVKDLLYNDPYRRFIVIELLKLTQQALIERELKSAFGLRGLGDCYLLTDPNLPDNPIVFCSDGFVSMTGYSYEESVNRNCRFLHKREFTNIKSISRIRKCLDNGEDVVELLLNFRKDGTPFWNLLFIAHICDVENNRTLYQFGAQIDVTLCMRNIWTPENTDGGTTTTTDCPTDCSENEQLPDDTLVFLSNVCYYQSEECHFGQSGRMEKETQQKSDTKDNKVGNIGVNLCTKKSKEKFTISDCEESKAKEKSRNSCEESKEKEKSGKSREGSKEKGKSRKSGEENMKSSSSSLGKSIKTRIFKGPKKTILGMGEARLTKNLTLEQQSLRIVQTYSKYMFIKKNVETQGFDIIGVSDSTCDFLLNQLSKSEAPNEALKHVLLKYNWLDVLGTTNFLSFRYDSRFHHYHRSNDAANTPLLKRLEVGAPFEVRLKLLVPEQMQKVFNPYRNGLQMAPVVNTTKAPTRSNYKLHLTITGFKSSPTSKTDIFCAIVLPN